MEKAYHSPTIQGTTTPPYVLSSTEIFPTYSQDPLQSFLNFSITQLYSFSTSTPTHTQQLLAPFQNYSSSFVIAIVHRLPPLGLLSPIKIQEHHRKDCGFNGDGKTTFLLLIEDVDTLEDDWRLTDSVIDPSSFASQSLTVVTKKAKDWKKLESKRLIHELKSKFNSFDCDSHSHASVSSSVNLDQITNKFLRLKEDQNQCENYFGLILQWLCKFQRSNSTFNCIPMLGKSEVVTFLFLFLPGTIINSAKFLHVATNAAIRNRVSELCVVALIPKELAYKAIISRYNFTSGFDIAYLGPASLHEFYHALTNYYGLSDNVFSVDVLSHSNAVKIELCKFLCGFQGITMVCYQEKTYIKYTIYDEIEWLIAWVWNVLR